MIRGARLTSILVVSFAMGIGVALNGPAWQAIVAELVPRAELPAAVALNSMGFNIARAVGPAVGGLVVAAAGPGPAFLLNAASFLGTVFVLYQWERLVPASPLPTERLVGAMRGGVRYVRYTPALRTVIVRSGGYIVFAIAIMALLPLIACHELHCGPTGFGVLSQPLLVRFRLPPLEGLDLSPTKFTPAPRIETPFDRGPVMVLVRYQVADENRPAFMAVMRDMEHLRRRNGAISWSLYEDAEAPGVLVESFLVDSWLEHLRQHERATASDAAIRDRARALHRGPEPPAVSHLLAAE